MDYGADVNATDNFKWTPLHHACHTGQKDVVEFLLQNGANLDAAALNGGTPLFRAIEASQVNNEINYYSYTEVYMILTIG